MSFKALPAQKVFNFVWLFVYLVVIFDSLKHPTFSSEKRIDMSTMNMSSN